MRIFCSWVRHEQAIAATVTLSIVSAVLLLGTVPVLRSDAAFAVDGDVTQGRVLEKRIAGAPPSGPVLAAIPAHGGRRGPRAFIDYEYFDVAAVRHTGRSQVSRTDWDQLQVGGPVTVIYLKGRPAQSRVGVALSPPRLLMIGLCGTGLLAAVGAAWAFLVGMSSLRLQLDLFQNGVGTMALVREVKTVTRRKRRQERTLQYCYWAADTLAGPPVLSDGSCTGTGRWGKSAQKGDWLLVLLDPADPRRHIVDLHGLRTETLMTGTRLSAHRTYESIG
jgi:hypothetical protein